MSFNGSGTFLINTAGQPVVSGTVISSTAFNALTADLATGLSTAITKDGQTTVTANIPMSTYKFTGLGVGSAATDSANLSQVQSTVTKLLTSVSGTDTITAVGAPVVAAYAAGQMFYFVATGDNTGAVTLNIDSLGAKAVTRDGSVALVAGDIKSGEVVVVVYDGTRFQVVSQLNSAGNATFANVSITSALNVGGVATFTANPVLSGGTANGVLYLNGSKVATSGSALTYDGTTFTSGAHTLSTGVLTVPAGSAAAPSITTTGDTNTGIFFPAADTIAFTEGGVEAARIDSSGNLGIGTTSPGSKLEISASNPVFTIYNTNTGDNGITWESDAASGASRASLFLNYVNAELRMTAGAGGGSYFQSFYTNGTERARISATGDFGIGTSSPAYKLDVNGNIRQSSTALVTAVAGLWEYDGSVNYVTPSGTQRGVVPGMQYYALNASLAGANVNTAQSVLGVGVTLSSNTRYAFEAVYALSKTAGTTSHTTGIGFGGTATINNIGYWAQAGSINSTGFVDLSNSGSFQYYIQTAANTVLNGAQAQAATFRMYKISGTVSVGTGGTFIPQYTLSAAPGGAYTTAAGCWFRIYPIGAAGSNVSVGTWA